MKHYGDITKLNGAELPVVDIITGGSPCQDLSVAGKRAGLAGERSGLFMEQIRVIKEMRENDRANGRANEHIRPRYMVWENVLGALSSNKGEDFRCVLEETAKIVDQNAVIPRLAMDKNGKQKWSHSGAIMGDGWSIAWRVHDAQFWGVPQRRKRISLVADFGGGSAPEILFERESVSGNPETSGKEGKAATETTRGSIEETSEPILLESNQNHATIQTDGVSTSLPASMGMGGGYVPMITDKCLVINKSYGFEPGVAKRLDPENRFVEEKTPTIRAGMGDNQTSVVCVDQGGGNNMPYVLEEPKCIGNGQLAQLREQDTVGTLNCMHDQQAVITVSHGGFMTNADNSDIAHTLAVYNSIVRRLTPLECERLQGFPDGWTDIGEWVDSKGKKHKDADSPRYRALGNSIALPYWAWMAERMVSYLDVEKPTMGSLFDGIGGFPLVYSRCGVKPVWASEIEEFPIAVTKKRFGED